MGSQQRASWQAAAAKANQQWARERDAALTTYDLATSLLSRIDDLRIQGT